MKSTHSMRAGIVAYLFPTGQMRISVDGSSGIRCTFTQRSYTHLFP